MEKYELVGSAQCKKVLAEHPDYKVFWQSGYSFKGASESEDDKQTKLCPCHPYFEHGRLVISKTQTFEERMQSRYDWSCAIDIRVDNDKREIHFNGFSVNDMY